MSNKFNKGEWSEFYVFLHILVSGKLHAADSNLQMIPNVYYNILAVIKNEIKYQRNTEENNIVFNVNDTMYHVPIQKFIDLETIVINKIQNSSGTFTINETDELLNELKIGTIKERSLTKGDIQLQIHDDYTGFQPTLSFSIKSYLGSNPTLLNASNGTILTYELTKKLKESEFNLINEISGRAKVKDRIESIRMHNSDLKYLDIPSEIFKRNLQMIDYRLPEIISEIYLESYLVKGKKTSDVVEAYLNRNPSENPEIIRYKVKEFLVAIALGMVPLTTWSGLDEATGGYIVVKANTEIVCYHIYDRNKLKDYLYNYTKFDTPSLSRYSNYRAGFIQSNEENQIINLVMQIRF